MSNQNLKKDTQVRVSIHPGLEFKGKIVGVATTDITQTHIIECTDGTLPNEVYQYNTCVAPLSTISVIE